MKEELLFCPLGGSGEIGMNMNLFANSLQFKFIIDKDITLKGLIKSAKLFNL